MGQKAIGILTSGGDCPGLNAAIRAVGKATRGTYGNQIIGFRDGFRGLVENRIIRLDNAALSGILTLGGTILGTSRDKPHKMPVGSQTMNMLDVAVDAYQKHHLDALVVLGGNGSQKNAYRLVERGLNVITLPKTIDNDVWGTDVTFGFDTAMSIAAEAIDRLHTTAESHHRVIVVEIMGHKVGWLALGAGIAGGADIILIPEIPYDIERVADAVVRRSRAGKRFSIIAMAEGALSLQECTIMEDGTEKQRETLEAESASARLAHQLEAITGLQARVTALGHLQRGGTPSATDRLLATRLGTACAELIEEEKNGVMVAIRGNRCKPVPLKKVAGRLKIVRPDHPWVHSARLVGTSFGD